MKFKKGLVSAILPTFNRMHLLSQRIDEIKNQTYQNWELIIVNDCSTDGTKEYLDSINDDRIFIVHLDQNSGCVSIPRNIGICKCSGEFIAPIDDDVFSLKNKFELLVKSFDDDCVLIYGNRLEKKQDKIYAPIPNFNWNPLITHGVDNSQFIYRKSVYDNVPLIFPTKACDWHIAKHIAPLGKIKHINEYVSIYEWHDKNRSHNKNKIEIFPERYENFYRNFKVDYSNNYN